MLTWYFSISDFLKDPCMISSWQYTSDIGISGNFCHVYMWTRVQPAYAANMWNDALNKQLVTQELDLYGILEETMRREMSFDELLTIREQDE
ncbi:unnamed protein product [Brassica oleracea var. botrytis]|nr:unnamed protein product [Brassica napus]